MCVCVYRCTCVYRERKKERKVADSGWRTVVSVKVMSCLRCLTICAYVCMLTEELPKQAEGLSVTRNTARRIMVSVIDRFLPGVLAPATRKQKVKI